MPGKNKRKRKTISPSRSIDSNSNLNDSALESVQDMFANLSNSLESDKNTNTPNPFDILSTKLDTIIKLLNEIKENQRIQPQKNTVVDTIIPDTGDQIPINRFSDRREKYKAISELENLLNLRRDVFYSKIRHEGIKIAYDKGLKSNPIRIPNKLRVKVTNRDPPEIIANKKRLAIQKVENEVERLSILAKFDSDKLDNLEATALQISTNASTTNLQNELEEWWKNKKTEEEERSNEIWSKRKDFFESNKHTTPIDILMKATSYSNVVRTNLPIRFKNNNFNRGHTLTHNNHEEIVHHRRNDPRSSNHTIDQNIYNRHNHIHDSSFFDHRQNRRRIKWN